MTKTLFFIGISRKHPIGEAFKKLSSIRICQKQAHFGFEKRRSYRVRRRLLPSNLEFLNLLRQINFTNLLGQISFANLQRQNYNSKLSKLIKKQAN